KSCLFTQVVRCPPPSLGVQSEQETADGAPKLCNRVQPSATASNREPRFDRLEHVTCATPAVLVVLFGDLSRDCSGWGPNAFEKLIRLLVPTDDRLSPFVRLLVQGQYAFHPVAKVGGQPGNAQLFSDDLQGTLAKLPDPTPKGLNKEALRATGT